MAAALIVHPDSLPSKPIHPRTKELGMVYEPNNHGTHDLRRRQGLLDGEHWLEVALLSVECRIKVQPTPQYLQQTGLQISSRAANCLVQLPLSHSATTKPLHLKTHVVVVRYVFDIHIGTLPLPGDSNRLASTRSKFIAHNLHQTRNPQTSSSQPRSAWLSPHYGHIAVVDFTNPHLQAKPCTLAHNRFLFLGYDPDGYGSTDRAFDKDLSSTAATPSPLVYPLSLGYYLHVSAFDASEQRTAHRHQLHVPSPGWNNGVFWSSLKRLLCQCPVAARTDIASSAWAIVGGWQRQGVFVKEALTRKRTQTPVESR
ncbi:hypothetical protein CPC08DRAFT_767898 [Agrocybe pediades]|nr:hypothetical protein CPC08DRAFT_767898 [Agrocybe pediades]